MQHYPRTLIGQTVWEWCDVCKRYTHHRIDAVSLEKNSARLGPCLMSHGPELTKAQRDRRERARQGNLFAPERTP